MLASEIIIRQQLIGTPMEGTGKAFMECTVDPLLLVSIGLAESNLARAYGKVYNDSRHNAFGLMSDGKMIEFNSWEESIHSVCKTVTRAVNNGVTTLSMLGAVYAEDPAWQYKVQVFYDKLLLGLDEL